MSFRVKDKQQGITYKIVEEGELLETGDKPIIDMSKKVAQGTGGKPWPAVTGKERKAGVFAVHYLY